MEKNRPLTIFKYLWDHTDEDHPAIITEILAYLEASGFHATRKPLPQTSCSCRKAVLTLSVPKAAKIAIL